MAAPKPIALTQVDAGDYAGPAPQPFVVVGDVPGGGSGPVAIEDVVGLENALDEKATTSALAALIGRVEALEAAASGE